MEEMDEKEEESEWVDEEEDMVDAECLSRPAWTSVPGRSL